MITFIENTTMPKKPEDNNDKNNNSDSIFQKIRNFCATVGLTEHVIKLITNFLEKPENREKLVDGIKSVYNKIKTTLGSLLSSLGFFVVKHAKTISLLFGKTLIAVFAITASAAIIYVIYKTTPIIINWGKKTFGKGSTEEADKEPIELQNERIKQKFEEKYAQIDQQKKEMFDDYKAAMNEAETEKEKELITDAMLKDKYDLDNFKTGLEEMYKTLFKLSIICTTHNDTETLPKVKAE